MRGWAWWWVGLFTMAGAAATCGNASRSEVHKKNYPQKRSWFLMTSHVEEHEGLHLAVSADGLKWEVVNGDKSVLKPTIPGVFRDPSIARDREGTFHLVWTMSWSANHHGGIGYASSKDLIHWSAQRIIPVMQNEPTTENVWAPELFWDEDNARWIIHWASSVGGKFPETLPLYDGHANGRIYYTTTRDFKTFTPSTLLFNADCLAIDSYVYRESKGHYYVFFKADRKEEPKRGIFMARGTTATGPYVMDPHCISGIDEPWAEGPCAVKVGSKTRLYYTTPGYYAAYETTDMTNWTSIRKEMTVPSGYRHGTVIQITEQEGRGLLGQEWR